MRFNRNRDQHVEFCGTTLRTVSQHILPNLWNWRTSNGQLIVDYRNSNGPKKKLLSQYFQGEPWPIWPIWPYKNDDVVTLCSTRKTPSASISPKFFRWSHGRAAQILAALPNRFAATHAVPAESAQGSFFFLRDLWQHERPTVYIYKHI